MTQPRVVPRAVLSLSLAAACGIPDPDLGSEASGDGSGSDPGSSGPGMTSTSGPPPGTTSSGDPTTGLDGDTSEATGWAFVDPTGCGAGPGGSVWHCTFECSVVDQDCPEGERCMPWANDGGPAWNASRCSPLDPDAVEPGQPCTVEAIPVSGLDDCALGSMCWAVDPDTLQGTCIAFCDPDEPAACGEPQRCVPLNDGNVPVCLSPCDPLQEGTCPEGEACRLVTGHDEFSCLPLQGGQVETSAVCTDEICDPTSTCLDGRALPRCDGSCCTPWCDLDDPGADAECAAIDPALACEAFYEPGAAPAGLETLGTCASLP